MIPAEVEGSVRNHRTPNIRSLLAMIRSLAIALPSSSRLAHAGKPAAKWDRRLLAHFKIARRAPAGFKLETKDGKLGTSRQRDRGRTTFQLVAEFADNTLTRRCHMKAATPANSAGTPSRANSNRASSCRWTSSDKKGIHPQPPRNPKKPYLCRVVTFPSKGRTTLAGTFTKPKATAVPTAVLITGSPARPRRIARHKPFLCRITTAGNVVLRTTIADRQVNR